MVYMDIFNRARTYVHVMTPYLILDGELETAIKYAAQRGVEVKLILPGIPDKELAYSLAKAHYKRLVEAGVKVYIVPDADKLTEQAQNALLKTLEEPPAYVRFVLTAPAKDRLLDTIVSRVQTFSLQTPPPAECAAWVLRNKPEADPEKVQTLSVQMNGNIGRVLAALQEETDDPALAAAAGVLGTLLQPDENPLLQAMAPFSKDRALFGEMMRRAGLILRDACVLRAGAKALVGGAPETAEKLAKTLPQKNLMTMAEICRQMETDAGRNANMALLSTVACAKLRTAAGK
jgi:hypothetical protein